MSADIKLIDKAGTGNFANGYLDFDLKDGVFQLVRDDEQSVQAVLKATVTSVDPGSGYGVGIRDFRGQKDLMPVRLAIAIRIMRTVAVLERFYYRKFLVASIETWSDKGRLTTTVTLDAEKQSIGGVVSGAVSI